MTPTSQQEEFLKDLYVGHLGEKKTVLQCGDCVYLPGITEDVKQYIRKCYICQSAGPNQQKKTLILYDVPSGLWERDDNELFQYKSHYYLLVANYFSNFLLVRKLSKQTTVHVMSLLKTVSSEHGIPAYVFTDQGRQFTSAEFQECAKCYQFEIYHSTPRYPQSNGFIEAVVRIVKQTVHKVEQSGRIHILHC